MSTLKTVRFGEVKDAMEQMLRAPIFGVVEKRILGNTNKKCLDPNLVMNARHNKMFYEPLSPSKNDILEEAKRLIFDEENQTLHRKREEDMLETELKRFQSQIRKSRPKFRGPYTCSRKMLANSDDEEFWSGTIGATLKDVKKLSQSIAEESVCSGVEKEVQQVKTGEEGGNYDPCSIVVTIKDKPITESKGKQFEAMRRVFLALKHNVVHERRLRELKIKVQSRITKQRLQRTFEIWRTRVANARTRAEKKKEGREMSKERKIELFINAITEKQKEIARQQKSAPVNKSPTIVHVQRAETACLGAPRKTSARSVIVVESPAQNRLNTQKKIIEEQKARLAEQNKIIEDLKLKQLEKETRRASKQTLVVAKEALVHCGRQTRRNIVQLMRQEGSWNDSAVEPPRLPPPPKFLMRMEARAEARRERAKKSQEEREKKLEERKKKEEAERRAEEEERKKLQFEALKEQRRQREEQEQRRAREAERNKQLNEKADDFRRKYLLRRYVMEPFFKLIEMKYNYIKRADDHYRSTLLRKCLFVWTKEYREEVSVKMELATSVYHRNLLWYAFRDWREFAKSQARMMQVATDFYDMRLLEKCAKSWHALAVASKVVFLENERIALEHFRQRLRAKFFSRWRNYPMIARDSKEREKRKDKWRQMVQGVIPDFDPKQRGVAIED